MRQIDTHVFVEDMRELRGRSHKNVRILKLITALTGIVLLLAFVTF